MATRILIVGAGAVGKVYGYHLARGGAEVTFFAKPRYASTLRDGVTLNRLRWWRASKTVHWNTFDVISEVSDVATRNWDQVWLCVSSTALRGDWLTSLCQAAQGASTLLVGMQPTPGDHELLRSVWGSDELVMGVITFIAWHGSTTTFLSDWRPEVSYVLPPLSPNLFTGERSREAVDALQRGGCPARSHENGAWWAARAAAILIPTVAALETVGWSFDQFAAAAPIASNAARETLEAMAANFQQRAPWVAKLLSHPWSLRALLKLSSALAPFELEPCIKAHFSKVADQTRMMLEAYMEAAEAQKTNAASLQKLRQLLA